MPKPNFITALFAKNSSLNGDDRHAPADPDDLTALEREQIAAQIRAIATRAANDYHRRCEQIPPHVLSAMKCGLNDWQAPAQAAAVTRPIQEKTWKIPVLELVSVIVATLALVPIIIFAVHRYKSEQAVRAELTKLREQNGDVIQKLDKMKREAASAQETLRSRDQSLYINLKKDSDQERRDFRALRKTVLEITSKHVTSSTNHITPNAHQQAFIPAKSTPPAESAAIRFAVSTQDDTCTNQFSRKYEFMNTSSQSTVQEKAKSTNQPVAQSPDSELSEYPLVPVSMSSQGNQPHAGNNRAAPHHALFQKLKAPFVEITSAVLHH
jgi:septum formation topological specificity factor MinE